MPPSIWPSTACGLIALPTSCAVPIQTTRVRPRSTSTSTTTFIAAHANATCARSPADLARLGIERLRARVAVDALDVDLAAGSRRAPRAPRGTRRRTAPAAIHVMRDADAEPDEPTASVEPGASAHVVGAELGARDLEDHVRHALADLGRGAVHLGASRRATEPHARGAGVVEALRVADVLEADREADAALDALAARRVARAAGQADRVARQLLGLRHAAARRQRGSPRRPAASRRSAARSAACRPGRARSAAAARPDRSRARPRACPSAPRRRSSVCTAPKPRIAPHGGLFV